MSSTRSSARPLSYTGPRPLQLIDSNAQSGASASPSASSCPSPTVSGLSTPPPTASNLQLGKARRQSSISYIPSDSSPTWSLRSPNSSAAPSLKRSLSMGQAVTGVSASSNRRSVGSPDELQSPPADRGPLTLTEKHADLLQFIAQKESKCLELRSQLAMHEAELAQLKRKWERIVSRGMDRSPSTTPNTTVTSPLSPLDGIKDGVGRLLASGLGELSSPMAPPSTIPVQSHAGFTTVSRAAARHSRGHGNSQSTSSVSTAGTASTSMRLSQSSASSLTFDEPPREQDEKSDGEEPKERRGSVGILPANATRAAKLHRRKSRDSPSTTLPNSPTTPIAASPMSPTNSARASKRASLNMVSGLPPPASIPGIGTLTVQPVSSWMETVGSSFGRKLEELQKGDTFTKSQKRASVLFSDVSQSLFSALASPGPTSASSVSVSSNPFSAALSPLSTSPSPSPSPVVAAQTTRSLLEDDDGEQSLGSVLLPDSRPPPTTTLPQAGTRDQSDDEWNW